MILRAISGYLDGRDIENALFERSMPTFLERHYILCYPVSCVSSGVVITHNKGVVEVQRFPRMSDPGDEYRLVVLCASDPGFLGRILGIVEELLQVGGGVL